MTNKAALFLVIIIGLMVILACRQFTQVGNGGSNVSNDGSRSFTLAGKEWSSYDLDQTDVKADFPGKPKDQSPQMPPNAKEIFSAMRIYAYDDKDFRSSVTELTPTGKRKWNIKDLADTSMTALKKQLPGLTYTLDIKSETNAKYHGAFTDNGKSIELRGCCVYKKADPARVWAVLTLYARDNADAQTTAQRIIDSVVFKGSPEECK